MTRTRTITTSKTRNPFELFLKCVRDTTFFPLSVDFIKYKNDLCKLQKIIDMPMNFFVPPKMPLYPLIKTIQCRSDINVISFFEMINSSLSYHDREITRISRTRMYAPFIRDDIGIYSYKTDSVSYPDDIT